MAANGLDEGGLLCAVLCIVSEKLATARKLLDEAKASAALPS